jgi:hypothetical protein
MKNKKSCHQDKEKSIQKKGSRNQGKYAKYAAW